MDMHIPYGSKYPSTFLGSGTAVKNDKKNWRVGRTFSDSVLIFQGYIPIAEPLTTLSDLDTTASKYMSRYVYYIQVPSGKLT